MVIDARQWSEGTRAVLRRSGWHEGRDVGAVVDRWRNELSRSDDFIMFPAAEAALREFGGLRVEVSGSGRTYAKVSFEIDPTLAMGEKERFVLFERQVGSRLFPLGEALGGNAFMAISEDGRVFLLSDEPFPVAPTIVRAIDALVMGGPDPDEA